ncbi:hypothetical protein WR25_05468 isoform D [Diploscapter pachys]|nr:hypothetical protein WR25_05468 isoform D [Diploscapter pachys]
MIGRSVCISLLLLCELVTSILAANNAVIVLPSYLKANASNSITITPTLDASRNLDIKLQLQDMNKVNIGQPIKLTSVRSAIPRTVSFDVLTNARKATLNVFMSDHETFSAELPIQPDVAVIHLYLSKLIYRPGEEVQIRALPLDSSGLPYEGVIEFALLNSYNFELTRKRENIGNDYTISTSFKLPDHLYFGDWHILAYPYGFKDLIRFQTTFKVKEYELPAFKVEGYVKEEFDPSLANFLIEARYFYGMPIDGTISFFCESNGRHQIAQTEMRNGTWEGIVNLTKCTQHDKTKVVSIRADIRDKGTGSKGSINLIYDPFAPKFDLIPLRPAFNQFTEYLYFVTEPWTSLLDATLLLHFECLTGDERMRNEQTETVTETLEVDLGDVVEFELAHKWRSNCDVIIAKAQRKLSNDHVSRSRTLIMPNLRGVPSFEPRWIILTNPQPNYMEGDQLEVKIDRRETRRLNSMIICNGNRVMHVDAVRDDRKLSIPIDNRMAGRCLLCVFSPEQQKALDVLVFFVKNTCNVAAEAFKVENMIKRQLTEEDNVVSPGETIQLLLRGGDLAVVRAIDDRLNGLAKLPEALQQKFWDLTMFDKQIIFPKQSRIVNLIDLTTLTASLDSRCSAAGKEYYRVYKQCPQEVIESASSISDTCHVKMTIVCQQVKNRSPESVPSCKQSDGCQAQSIHSARMFNIMPRLLIKPTTARPIFDDSAPTMDPEGQRIRENFQEVLLFDAVKLKHDELNTIDVKAVDTIGQWSVSSVFWNKGYSSLCAVPDLYFNTLKNVFMQVEMPKNVYVNETVTAKITVTGRNVHRSAEYSICIVGLPRKICADEGSQGQKGKPTYSNAALTADAPVQTKIMSFRFLTPGPANITFQLRKQASFPGKTHCEVGTVLDAVRIQMMIAKRADTVEYFKRVVLDASKPVIKKPLNDVLGIGEPSDIFEVTEHRLPEDPSALVTRIQTNILNTDTVYSFNIDISKFLPMPAYITETVLKRKRRNIVDDPATSFLSDDISHLSVELYSFKTMQKQSTKNFVALEESEARISNLISSMLQFSDCKRGMAACGFSEYKSPATPNDRSMILTAVTTSLLCEATVDESIVHGPIKFITQSLGNYSGSSNSLEDSAIQDIVDIDKIKDRKMFTSALLLQVARDCAGYKVTASPLWRALYNSFYLIDDEDYDGRTLASIAFMGTNFTQELMRIRMAERINSQTEPYWSAGSALNRVPLEKKSNFDELQKRRTKSGDILVNSLGILAFVTPGAEGNRIEWDPLADWLYKQQNEDGTFQTALDTYFASRALYEYRHRKIDIDNLGDVKVTVRCEGDNECRDRVVNVTDAPTTITIPNSVRNVSLITRGIGKVNAAVRILATKRMRTRRGLSQDEIYPVRISVSQEKVTKKTIQQTVCITSLSPVITTLELQHGLYTGYTTSRQNLIKLANSSQLDLLEVSPSTFAVHFILSNLPLHKAACYQIGITEPTFSYEPIHLAPVAIQARHVVNGM